MEPVTAMLIGGAVSGLLGGIMGKGKKPNIPDFPTIDPDAEQRKAIAGNERNFAASAELATKTNAFNQGELQRMLRVAIPNYDELLGKGGKGISSMMSGELPQDVVSQIQRNSAERAGAGGFGSTGMGRNLEARDLGLTSLQLTQTGLSSAERWMSGLKSLSVPGQFDVASMFLSPAQRIGVQSANNAGRFQRDSMAAQVAAAPDPTMAAIGGMFSQIGGAMFGAGLTSAFSSPATTPRIQATTAFNPNPPSFFNQVGGMRLGP